jgi:hypothetical protein
MPDLKKSTSVWRTTLVLTERLAVKEEKLKTEESRPRF